MKTEYMNTEYLNDLYNGGFMKIILTQDVKKHGKKGDIIEVADGFGMNYLIKNNLGMLANETGMKQLEKEKKHKEKELETKIEFQIKDKDATEYRNISTYTIKNNAEAELICIIQPVVHTENQK